MLKTNSKQARENLRKYIIETSEDYLIECAEYDGKQIDTSNFSAVASAVYETFMNEYGSAWIGTGNAIGSRRNMPENAVFRKYAEGLPCGGLFDYFLHSAVDTVGNILQETEAEKSRFTETKAENMLTSLIYREIKKAL